MTRPEQSVTGWPASCLTLSVGTYAAVVWYNPDLEIPVSADAQARMDADRLTNHIRGRMVKIQAEANNHKWGHK